MNFLSLGKRPLILPGGLFLIVLLSGACTHTPLMPVTSFQKPVRVTMVSEAKNTPYRVDGVIYHPNEKPTGYTEEGVASWYGPGFHGKLTSNREVYNMHSLTAAHKTLPFNTQVRITRLDNHREVTVRINDRGPFVSNRIIDLSHRAAQELGMLDLGTVPVQLTILRGSHNRRKHSQVSSSQAYSVQVGLFQNPILASQLSADYESGHIQSFQKGNHEYHRVLVGTYTDYKDALQKMDEIRRGGLPQAFVIAHP